MANIHGFGAAVNHDTYCKALLHIVTDPVTELREYLRRDILNLALRNTDNHGRNAALLIAEERIQLSPIFDFAPMFLDPEGIGRVSRWENEQAGSQPEWAAICEKFKDLAPPLETRKWLAELGSVVRRLPDTMQEEHVDDYIIHRLANWIGEIAAGLEDVRH